MEYENKFGTRTGKMIKTLKLAKLSCKKFRILTIVIHNLHVFFLLRFCGSFLPKKKPLRNEKAQNLTWVAKIHVCRISFVRNWAAWEGLNAVIDMPFVLLGLATLGPIFGEGEKVIRVA